MRTIKTKHSEQGNANSQRRAWYVGWAASVAVAASSSCGGGGTTIIPQPPASGGPAAGTANISGQLVEGAGGRITSASGDSLASVLVQLINTTDGRLSGVDTTDLQGRYEFKGVPSGTDYLLKIEFMSNRDLNGDGANDEVELTLPLNPAEQASLALLSRLGVVDSDNNGRPDALRFENEIGDDKGGLRRRDSEHRFETGQTVVDDNSNGRFDDDVLFDDSDCDGLPDDNGSGSSGDSSRPSERELYGSIEAITAGSITVQGVRCTLTTATRFLGRDNETLRRENFTTGRFVEVEGFNNSTGIVVYKVKLEDQGQDANGTGGHTPGDEIEKTGNIEALSASSIRVGGTEFRLSETTQWRIGGNRNADPALFSAGMRVEVTGDRDSQGRWIARRVKAED